MLTDIAIAEKIGLDRRCGYWEVMNTFFFDKAECLRYASKINDHNVKYHFYDSAYRSLNWSSEPLDNLKEMYKRRAQQLRDSYDYLILSFSGGSDSTNILKTFLDNDIKLDEVYCEYPTEMVEKTLSSFTNDRSDSNQINYEWEYAAKPLLKTLAKTHPNIKITVESASKSVDNIVLSSNMHKLNRSGMLFNPNPRYDYLYEVVKSRTTIHGKVGCISGVDKPRLALNPKTMQFISVYADTNNLTIFPESARMQTGYDIYFDHFYLTYEYPELNQKQCFVLKNKILEILHSKNLEFYKSLVFKIHESGAHVFDTHHNFFKTALYDFWDNSLYQAGKSDNFFYPPNMKWYYDTNKYNQRTNDFLDKQIQEMLFGISEYFILNQNGKPSNFRHYASAPITF